MTELTMEARRRLLDGDQWMPTEADLWRVEPDGRRVLIASAARVTVSVSEAGTHLTVVSPGPCVLMMVALE